MQKLRTFFHVLVNSIAQPPYYQKLLNTKAWFSWQYFLFLNFLLSFIALIYVIPGVSQFQVEPVANDIASIVPEGVVISGDTSGIHINQERPYSIPFPTFLLDDVPAENLENVTINDVPYDQAADFNLVTFETDENITNVQDFYDAEALAVITESTIYLLDDAETGEVRVYAMPSFEESFSFSRADAQWLAQTIISHPFFAQKWYIPLLGLGAVLLTLPFSIWLRTIAIAVYTLFVWVIVAFFMKTKKLSYGKLFQVGLHSFTLPLLVKILVDYFQWFDFSGLWFLLAYLIWTLFLVSTIKTDGASKVTTPVRTSTARPTTKKKSPVSVTKTKKQTKK
jgi:hypothetical protein